MSGRNIERDPAQVHQRKPARIAHDLVELDVKDASSHKAPDGAIDHLRGRIDDRLQVALALGIFAHDGDGGRRHDLRRLGRRRVEVATAAQLARKHDLHAVTANCTTVAVGSKLCAISTDRAISQTEAHD